MRCARTETSYFACAIEVCSAFREFFSFLYIHSSLLFFTFFLTFFVYLGPSLNRGGSPKKSVNFKMDNYSDFDDSDLDIENIS